MLHRVQLLSLVLIRTWHHSEGTCGPHQFALDKTTCCDLCQIDWFVKVNCSKVLNTVSSTNCDQCTKCENGQRTVSPCTRFSNTVCEPEQTPTPTTSPVITVELRATENELDPTVIALYTTACVFLLLIVVATVYRLCLNHKTPVDPAENLLKLPLTV